ncbi:MAG: Crp/Fnr family transcriptional regulator [Chloroflexota bacterium]
MIEPTKLAAMMKKVPHFKELAIPELIRIVKAGKLKAVNSGDTLFWEGEPCAGLYVLLQGEIQLYKNGPKGQETIMAVIQPVSMVNEVPVLDHGPNPATLRVSAKGLVWFIDCDIFQGLMRQYPQLAFGLLPILAKRNRQLVSLYEDLSFLPVRSRTAKLILELSEDGENEIKRRSVTVQQMASRISTSPEVVSRTISFLSSRGFITSSRQRITVNNPKALQELSALGPGFNAEKL